MIFDVTAEGNRADARLQLDDLPAGAASYTIERRSPSGNVAGVRGAVGVEVSGPVVIVRDFEVPLDIPLVYTATVYDANGNVLATATVEFTLVWGRCEAWLVDLARPSNSLRVVIESMTTLDFELPVGVHRVLDRRAPILTTLPAWTPDTELVILTTTLLERDQVRALYGSGYPFLLRTAPIMGIGNAYFGLTDFKEERFLAPGAAPQRRFIAECVQVERPDPILFTPEPPNSYADVREEFADYETLRDEVASYDDLLYHFAEIGVVDPVTPWLPVDV